jgi:outer membrane protein
MKRLLALSLLAALPAAAQESATRTITLPEAYALTLARSEALAQSDEAVKEALARVDEIRGAILPRLTFNASENFQQNPRSGVASIDQTHFRLATLTLTQPIFSGFREFLAFKRGRRQAESLALTRRRAEALLYQDTAQAFYALHQVQNEISIRRSIIHATADRVEQLQDWARIGRSRDSEVLAVRSQLAQSLAQVALATAQENSAQELLRFLTGLDVRFAPLPADLPPAAPLEPFLVKAGARDDVEARRKDAEAARLFVGVESRQRWPVIGVTGNYYVLKRNGFSSNTRYDGAIGLSLPIFAGGQITAQVKEAEAAARSAGQALSAAERAARREVRTAHGQWLGSLAAVEALEKAAELAEANLKAQEKDYKLSLVNNLQVLDSINALQSTRLQLNAARQQAVVARAQLAAASGDVESVK